MILGLVLSYTYFSSVFFDNEAIFLLLQLARVFAFLKILFDIFTLGKPKNFFFNGLLIFAIIALLFTWDFNIISHLMIALAFRTEKIDSIIKKFFLINSALLFGIMLMSQIGIISGDVWIEADINRTRHLLGFDNPNMPMRSFFNIWISFIYLYWNKTRSEEYWVAATVVGLVLPFTFLQLTDSRMPMVSIIMGLLLLVVLPFVNLNKKSIKISLASIPIILTGMSLVVAHRFGQHNFLNRVLSDRPRFWNNLLTQPTYPLRFFGHHGTILHYLYNGERLILDNSYLYVLWVQGIGIFLIIFAILTYLIYHLAVKNDKRMLFLIIMILIYGFGENVFFDVGSSVLFFLIYSACEQLQSEFNKQSLAKKDKKKMKILYCITRSDWGGAQAHLFDLVKEMTSLGHICEVAIGENGELSQRLNEIGIKVHLLNSLIHEIHPIKDVKGTFELYHLIKEVDPDFIHLHSTKAGWIGRISGLFIKKKVIFTVHGWCFTEGATGVRKTLGRFIEKALVPITDKIICVSEYDKQLALRLSVGSSESLTLIYNGVSHIEKANQGHFTDQKIKVMMTARFAEPKDQETVIRAFEHIEKEFELYLVGDGPNLESCVSLTKELQLNDQIHFLGSRSDVRMLLQEMDIFILSSSYEGLPISIIEAMSVGLPIIASDVGGVSELVKEGENGYLFEPRDIKHLSNLIKGLADKEERSKLGKESLRIYEETFTLETCVSGVLNIYKRLYDDEVKS